MHSSLLLAEELIGMFVGMMSWAHFPDGTPNFRFENPENLRQKDVVMLFNFRSLENVMEQVRCTF